MARLIDSYSDYKSKVSCIAMVDQMETNVDYAVYFLTDALTL